MLSFSFIQRLITLPFVWVWISIQYVTVGTRFQQHEAFQKSLYLNLACISYLHIASGMTMKDVKRFGFRNLFDMLEKKESKLNPMKKLPNYGEIFTQKNNEQNIPDSAWLARHPQNKDKEDSVILHLHGGMMYHHSTELHIAAFSNLYFLFQKDGLRPPSILLVDYSLVPEGRTYPSQILECLNIYDRLLSFGYRKIIIVGDSAGGNLALSMLYHLNEKSKSKNVVWPSGVALISPWLDLTSAKNTKSYKYNAYKDVIAFETLQRCGRGYVQQNEHLYSQPLTNINLNCFQDFWSEFPPFKKGRFLLLVGNHEVLRDEILEWCLEKTSLGKNYPERIMIETNGIHEGIFLTETSLLYTNRITFEEWSQTFGVNALYNFIKEIDEKS
ncbi:esterase/lipase [Schizosaccharomyces cryophilus OY26]|uniref:Esterase/lipase n=1 Tax=Schizosaccharomyces cryophilus (strain OY26 / ATCC MYA-4695 / CBS 11777 / NBRC 106824 / NRRL Y48691) TaxID=653667 RepID=S9W159_SCHCR|nr:esterase/lipase [Schizosaccharomyces cryophilus OY26]EPY52234.1 esterase/lipase [Schizosaccharomyces cryophilus OY26]